MAEVRCQGCGRSWPGGTAYCGACGRPLAAPRRVPAGERKTVTVLFCDLVGSTAQADGADPEDVQAGLAAYQHLVRGVLERHGAAVEKFIGDAVMAVFGAPVAHEDDPERAVRAGLAILAAVQRTHGSGRRRFAVRIGVATGEVLVNLDARPELGETLVAGDLVNTAARLQTSAGPGTVVAGERTYQLTRGQLVYAALPEAVVKGKAAPLARWQATGTRAHHGAEAGVRTATAFVGRQAELAALQEAYGRVVAGPGLELVVVTGEPGVGKSRLVAEFFAWTDQRPELVRWRQGRCLPYGDQVTFHALGQIVKAEAGILDSDSEHAARGKLADTVAALTKLAEADRAWVTARLAPLAGLPSPGGAGQSERFAAWRRFLEALAATGPLVLVVEDAHWADAQLLAFLGHLAEYTEGAPILLIVTARPELATHAPEFGAEARTVIRLSLSPLEDTDTAALLAGLLGARLLEAGLQAQLLERAGGNPLFAEQVIHLLTEQKALRRRGRTVTLATPGGELPVPDSLAALITARLDTLPRPDKALLADASVIGRLFWSGQAAAVSGHSEDEVRAALRRLAAAGFVTRLPRSSMTGQAEYRFTHALVRDAAYHTLPRALRSQRHLAAADWLETHAAGHGAGTAEVIAHHALTALELAQSCGDSQAAEQLRPGTARRLTTAGEQVAALDLGATERHYAHAADIIGPGDPDRARLLCQWAGTSRTVGKPEQADRAAHDALALAQASHDTRYAGVARFWLGTLADDRGDYAEAEDMLTSAVGLLETLPTSEDLLLAYTWMAYIHARAARPAEGLAYCQRLLDLAPADSPWKVNALRWRAYGRAMLGDPAFGADHHEAIRLARKIELDDPYVLADTLTGAAEEFFWLMEGPEAALSTYREAGQVALRKGSTISVQRSTAYTVVPMFDLGHWDEVLATAHELRPLEGLGASLLLYIEPRVAAVLCWRGSLAEAHQFLDPVLPLARTMALQELLPALAAAVTLSAGDGNATQTLSLIEEYQQALAPAAPVSWHWGGTYLADIVRACIYLDDLDRARQFTAAAQPSLWRHRLQVHTAKAVIAEATGDPGAEQFYADAAAGWEQYGHILERGLALLGLGRCRHRSGQPDSSSPLLAARAIFAQLGAVTPLAETDSLLAQQTKQTS